MSKQYEVSVVSGNSTQRVGIYSDLADAKRGAAKLQAGTYDESDTVIRIIEGSESEDGEFGGKIIANIKP